jgi:hypothetical protein
MTQKKKVERRRKLKEKKKTVERNNKIKIYA